MVLAARAFHDREIVTRLVLLRLRFGFSDARISGESTRSAARAERLPSLSLSADYGAIGLNPSQAHGTFAVVGSLKFPIWQSGRIEGDIEQVGGIGSGDG